MPTISGYLPFASDEALIPLSGGVAPTGLSFTQVYTQRMHDPFPALGSRFLLFEDRFLNASNPTAKYVATTLSGTTPTITAAGGSLSASGAAAGEIAFNVNRQSAVAPYYFVRARVDVTPSTGSYVTVGIRNTSTGTIYGFRYLAGTGLQFVNGATATTVAAAAPPATLAAPFSLIAAYTGTDVQLFVQYDNGSVHALTARTGFGPDLRVPATHALYVPFLALGIAAAGTASVSHFCGGYTGALGSRDYRFVTYSDGTPYKRNGLFYFLGTKANSDTYTTNSMALWSFDPISLATVLIGHMFMPSAGSLGSSYSGALSFNPLTGVWTLISASWGLGTANAVTNVQMYYGTTTDDVISQAVTNIPGTILPAPMNTSPTYDATLRVTSTGTNLLVVSESGTLVLFSGSSLTSMTRVAQSGGGENMSWTRINGTWYIIANGNQVLDANLANPVTITGLNPAGPSLQSGSPYPASAILTVVDQTTSRYLMLCFDGTSLTGGQGSVGGMIVSQGNQTVTGHELPRRRLIRF